MTERLEPKSPAFLKARRRTPASRAGRVRGPGTVPVPSPTGVPDEGEPTLLGFPAEFADEDDDAAGPSDDTALDAAPGLTVVRRADPVGAGILILAGVPANVSLLLSWSPGEGPTGLWLVQRGVEALRAGAGLVHDLWEPPVVVVSGGVLVLLGLLLLVPARTHRLVGVLALIVSLAAATAVVLLILESGLVDDRFGPGMWCAVAVPVLGVLGALKAMLTVPVVTLAPDSSTFPDRVTDGGR